MTNCDFRKNEFKIKNINNLTTEQVKGKPFKYIVDKPVFIGTMTHADEEYLYGTFEHNGNEDILLIFTPNESTVFSMELSDEQDDYNE